MAFLRNHWYDVGLILCIPLSVYLMIAGSKLSNYQLLMWLSLGSLFLHQAEEYRFPGTFPGMVNRVMFQSEKPDCYPLNTQTALIINVGIGWSLYGLGAFFSEKAIWLGIAAMMVSLGNFIAHTFVFNIRAKSFYNPGLITSWLLFLPCIYYFSKFVICENLAHNFDYIIGILLGVIVNIFGVFRLIVWLSKRDSPYTFFKRQL
jgi:hypothetical protein